MLRDGGVLEDAYMVTNAILKGSQVKIKGVPRNMTDENVICAF